MTDYIDTLKARFSLLNRATKSDRRLYCKCYLTLCDMFYELLLTYYNKRIAAPAQLHKYVTVAAAYVHGSISKEKLEEYNKHIESLANQALDETIEEKNYD